METAYSFAMSFVQVVREEPILSGLAVLIIYFFIRTTLLSRRITRLLTIGDGTNIESSVHTLQKKVTALESNARVSQMAIDHLDARMKTALRGVSVERFDPFQQNGGQQSFSVALVNEKGSGVVVSGIHSRDQVRVYAKPVAHFVSEHELSEEETRALAKTKKDLAT